MIHDPENHIVDFLGPNIDTVFNWQPVRANCKLR
jgi:hypothetical protein